MKLSTIMEVNRITSSLLLLNNGRHLSKMVLGIILNSFHVRVYDSKLDDVNRIGSLKDRSKEATDLIFQKILNEFGSYPTIRNRNRYIKYRKKFWSFDCILSVKSYVTIRNMERILCCCNVFTLCTNTLQQQVFPD
ncbi:hypothetical protein ATC1_1383 [Flexilinea flocculi]|uniref:Uncharacterized protein n=1 Tax=Flexilinea flocculi TaxID=1678840 RepID=A0A0S7BI92_9CHLR|nr:hypothetical protein ATC1_1383 [Flexilinea flocculi]